MAIKIKGSTIIDDSRIVVNADKIGIGTTNPQVALEIYSGDVGIGTTNPRSDNIETSLDTNTNILAVGIVTANEYYGTFKGTVDPAVAANRIQQGNTKAEVIDTGLNGHFIVETEGAERLRINETGHVGIGTDDPTGTNAITGNNAKLAVGVVTAKELHVRKDVFLGDDSADDSVLVGGLHSQVSEDTSKFAVQGASSLFNNASNIGIIQVHAGGYENIGDLAGYSFSHGVSGSTARAKAAIAFESAGGYQGVGAGYGRGDLCFYVDNAFDNNQVSAEDERLRITRFGDVGIGTTNPTGPNAVSSSNTTKLAVGIVTAREYYGTFKGTVDPNIAANRIEQGNTSAEVIDTGTDGRFRVITEGNERFSINKVGDLLAGGITTSLGGFMFGSSTYGGPIGEMYLYKSAHNAATLRVTSNGPYADFKDVDGDLQMGSAGSSLGLSANGEKVRITSAGNVGVGTTNPTKILHLTDNTNQTAIRLQNVGAGGTSWFVQSSGSGASNGQGNFSIYNQAMAGPGGTASDEGYALTITTENNVGIGTINPTGSNAVANNNAKLAVGIVTANEYYGTFKGTVDPAVAANRIQQGDTKAEVVDDSSALGHFKVITEGTERFRITDIGSVGIGTTQPIDKFQINSGNDSFVVTGIGSVGIGARFPSAPLQIYTTASQDAWKFRIDTDVSDGAGFYQKADGNFEMVLRDNANNVNHIMGTGGALTFTTSGTEKVRITSGGDVGIGTENLDDPVSSSNTAKLAVGIVTAREYYGIFKGTIDPVVADDRIQQGDTIVQTIDTGADGQVKIITNNVERVLIDPYGYLIARGDIRIRREGGAAGTQNNGGIYFGDSNNNYIFGEDSVETLTLTGGSGNFVAGETVTGGLSGVTAIVKSWDSINLKLVIHDKTGSFQNGETVTSPSNTTGRNVQSFTTTNADLLAFATAGEERLRINETGQVGIGTNNPTGPNALTNNTAKLAVGIVTANEYYGTFKGTIDPAVADDKIQKGNTKAEVIDTGTDGHFIVETEGQERLRITGIGSVGIGVDHPDSALDVVSSKLDGTSVHFASTYNNDGQTAVRRIEFGTINYRNAIQSQQGSGGDNFSSDVDLLLNPSGGDVGIGTTRPNDVVGAALTSKLAVGIVTANEYYGLFKGTIDSSVNSITVNTNLQDIFSVSGNQLSGVDAGSDKIVFWDDTNTAGELSYLTVGTGLEITNAQLNANKDAGKTYTLPLTGTDGGNGVGIVTWTLTDDDSPVATDTVTLKAGSNISISNSNTSEFTIEAVQGAGVGIAASASQVLNVNGGEIGGVDAGTNDKLVYWDTDALSNNGRLDYLAVGTGLEIVSGELKVDSSVVGKSYTLPVTVENGTSGSGGASGIATLTLTDDVTPTAGTDPVTIEAGDGIVIESVTDGFKISADISEGGGGGVSDVQVKQYSDNADPRTERNAASNPIDVQKSVGIVTIGIGTTSNAYGNRFVGPNTPSGAIEGDIWYDTTTTGQGTNRVAILRDEKTAGAYGGKVGTGEYAGARAYYNPNLVPQVEPNSWFPRVLNTKYDSSGFVSVGIGSTTQWALEAGKYKISWRVPAHQVDRFQSRLAYNTNSDFSGTTSYYYGTSQYSGVDPSVSGGGGASDSEDESEGEFVADISATTYFRIEQWIYSSGQTGTFGDGALGVAVSRNTANNTNLNLGNTEVYTQVKIEDLATAVKDEGFSNKIQQGDTKAEVIDTGTDGHFIVETEGQERLRITSDGHAYFNTCVGIGSTTPRQKFDVIGKQVITDTGGDVLKLESTVNTSRTTIRLNTDGNEWELGARGSGAQNATNSFYIYDFTASKYRMVINPTGNVGIGTITASEEFHIHQDTGTATLLISSPTAPQIRFNSSPADLADNDRTIFGQATGIDHFVSGSTAGDSVLRGTSTGNLLFGIATSEKVRITSTGNVGIGSTIPQTKLDVEGDICFNNHALVSHYDPGLGGMTGTNIDHIWHADVPNNYYGTGGVWNFVSDSSYKVVGNSAIQIGYLISSGGGHLMDNVGIGTTVPTDPVLSSNTSKLAVGIVTAHEAYINALNLNTSGAGVGDLLSNGGPDGIFGIYNTTNSGKTIFPIKDSSGTYNDILELLNDRAIIDGNVGIGSTIPKTKLDVHGTDAIVVPVGTTAERPSNASSGMFRYNTTEGQFEGYTNTWGAIAGGGGGSGSGNSFVLLAEKSSTSGTSVEFTGIPSDALEITLMFNQVSINGANNYKIQLGTASGYITTGYESLSQSEGGGSEVTETDSFVIGSSSGAYRRNGSMTIRKASSNSYTQTGQFGVNSSQGGNQTYGSLSSVSGTVDRLRVTTSGGQDFDLGTMSVSYKTPGGGSTTGKTKIAIIQDEKPDTTNGGIVSAVNTWLVRDLNAVTDPNSVGISSISDGKFSLPAGSYAINFSAPAMHVDEFQARLAYNTNSDFTGTTNYVYGSSEFSGFTASSLGDIASHSSDRSRGEAVLTLSQLTYFRIEQSFETSPADGAGNKFNYALGVDAHRGNNEVYTQVRVQDLATAIKEQDTGTTKVAVLQDVRTEAENGGTATAANWHGRRLNTKLDPTNFVTLLNGSTGIDGTANTFSLEAGTYFLQWRAPGFDAGKMIAKMAYTTDANYNTLFNSQSSAGVNYLSGETAQTSSGISATSSTASGDLYATGSATITITQTTYFRLQHYVSAVANFAPQTLGRNNDITGEDEIYSQVIVQDLATAVKSQDTGTTKVAILRDQKNYNVGSGTAAVNTWIDRDITVKTDPQSFVTLNPRVNGETTASTATLRGQANGISYFSLPAGIYKIKFRATGYFISQHKAAMVYSSIESTINKVYATSDSVNKIDGTSETSTSNTTSSDSTGVEIVNINERTYFKVIHYTVATTVGTTDFGQTSVPQTSSTGGSNYTNGKNVYLTIEVEDLATAVKPQDTGTAKVAVIKDQKNTGVAGGLFVKDAWRDRDLTVKDDPFNFVTLYTNASYQTTPGTGGRASYFSLPAGKYKIKFRAPALSVNEHIAAIGWSPNESDINKTYASGDFNSGGEIYGSSEVSNNNTTTSIDVEVSNFSEGTGIVEITQTSYFKVVHYSKDTSTTASGANLNTGFGNPVSIATPDPETYTIVEVEDLATAVRPQDTGTTRVAVVKDQKNNGIDGGTFTQNAWRDRDLTVKDDPFNFVTLYPTTNGQANKSPGDDPGYFTLPPGKYKIKFRAPAFKTNQHMARMVWSSTGSTISKTYATTDSFDGQSYGTSEFVNDSNGRVTSASEGVFVVEITQTSYFKVLHYGKDTESDNGFGEAATIGSDPETYTVIEIEDLATAVKSGVNASDKIEEGNTKAEVIDTGTDGKFKVTVEGEEKLQINSDGDQIISHLAPPSNDGSGSAPSTPPSTVFGGGIYTRTIDMGRPSVGQFGTFDEVKPFFTIEVENGAIAGTMYITANGPHMSASVIYQFAVQAGGNKVLNAVAAVPTYGSWYEISADISTVGQNLHSINVTSSIKAPGKNSQGVGTNDMGPANPCVNVTLVLAACNKNITVTKP